MLNTTFQFLKDLFGSIFLFLFVGVYKGKSRIFKPSKFTKKDYKENQLIRAGFISIAIVAILQISTANSLSSVLVVSSYFFVLSIVLLGLAVVLEFSSILLSENILIPSLNNLLNLFGIFSTLIAIFLLIFHISVGAGVLFIVLCILGILVFIYFFLFVLLLNPKVIDNKALGAKNGIDVKKIETLRNLFMIYINRELLTNTELIGMMRQEGITSEELFIIAANLVDDTQLNKLYKLWKLRIENAIGEQHYGILKSMFIAGLSDEKIMEVIDGILKNEDSMKIFFTRD